MDGAIIKNRFKNTLLLAVCLDGNNHIIILAYAIVSIENESNWMWFLKNLRILLNKKNYSEFCFISDRDKGLKSSLLAIFTESATTVCLRHLLANIKKKCKNKSTIFNFYKAALTFDSRKFDQFYYYLSSIPAIFDIIKENTNQWARSKISLPRYNQTTSNISESENSALRKYRCCSDLDAVIGIYNYINELFYLRNQQSLSIKTRYTTYCTGILKNNQNTTNNYSFKNSSTFVGVITNNKVQKVSILLTSTVKHALVGISKTWKYHVSMLLSF